MRRLVGVAVASGVLGLLLATRPLLAVATIIAIPVVASPRFSRFLLLATFAVTPTLNPSVFGLGSGRVYPFHVVVVLTTVGALADAFRKGRHRQAAAVVLVSVAYVALMVVGRDDPAIAWAYRPLQPFLVAFATVTLFRDHRARQPAVALAGGAIVGCALTILHALVPRLDPFALSRPADLPFVSTIGAYARATGAFVYPNNLGTFAAYVALVGLAALLFDRPMLPRPLALALVATAGGALVLSGARAAFLGLFAGVVYLTARARPGRKIAMTIGQLLVGTILILAVTTSETGRMVAEERVSTATGYSLTGRVDQWNDALESFADHPLVGVGAVASYLDSMWLLHLSTGGLVGLALLVALGRVSMRCRPPGAPELWVALLIAFCVSGVFQDSLGQTLASWALGAGMGVSLLGRAETRTEPVPLVVARRA